MCIGIRGHRTPVSTLPTVPAEPRFQLGAVSIAKTHQFSTPRMWSEVSYPIQFRPRYPFLRQRPRSATGAYRELPQIETSTNRPDMSSAHILTVNVPVGVSVLIGVGVKPAEVASAKYESVSSRILVSVLVSAKCR